LSPYSDNGINHVKMTKANNGYYLTGEAFVQQYNRVIILGQKINETGDIICSYPYPLYAGFDFYCSDVKYISVNRFLILYYKSRYLNDSLVSGALISDTNGVIIANREYAGTDYTMLRKVYISDPKNIFFIGSSNHLVSYKENVFLVKTDSTLDAPPVSVRNISQTVPDNFYLKQNYPNPFNSTTQIVFGIKKKGLYNLKIYDVTGKLITELFNQNFEPGEYKTDFHADNLSSGVYFYKLESSNSIITKKFVLLK
jgi:hypothetical protein